MSASHAAISFVNDLSASAQAQLNTLREGSATANNAISARFANSASLALNIGSIAAADVPNLSNNSNTFVGVLSNTTAPIYLKSTQPGVMFYESDEDADADEKMWRILATGGSFLFQGAADDGTNARTWLDVNRTGNSITDLSFSCSNVYVNGYSVLSPPGMNGFLAASWARLNSAQTFSKGQGSEMVALVDGATITPNCEDGNVFRVVLGGNRTMAAPTNARPGQTIVFHILQDGTGSRTLGWASDYKFAGSTDPTLTTTASACDVFAFNYDSTSAVWRQAGLNVG